MSPKCHRIPVNAHNPGRPEYFQNARGEEVISFRLFKTFNFESLCALLCGGRLSKNAS